MHGIFEQNIKSLPEFLPFFISFFPLPHELHVPRCATSAVPTWSWIEDASRVTAKLKLTCNVIRKKQLRYGGCLLSIEAKLPTTGHYSNMTGIKDLMSHFPFSSLISDFCKQYRSLLLFLWIHPLLVPSLQIEIWCLGILDSCLLKKSQRQNKFMWESS